MSYFKWLNGKFWGTLTESETKVLLEDGLTIGGKPLRYTFEAIGHAKAYDFMFTLLKNRFIKERDILTMHQMFYESIEKEYAGKYRDMDVFISGSKYPVTDQTDTGRNGSPVSMDQN